MKSFRIKALVAFVVLSTALAHADSIPTGDPIIRTGGGSAGTMMLLADPAAPAGIITPDFTIVSQTGSSPATSPCVLIQGTISTSSPECLFENNITQSGVGLTIASLTFDAPSVPFDPITDLCGFLSGSPFSHCGVDPLPGGGTKFIFDEGVIPFHTDFTLEFEGFAANTSFGTTAGIVPEPGTLALFVGGIGALLARRRLCAR